MLIFYLVCVLQLHTALSQFPDHYDFQKEGEVFIKGEKFNVLKLSKHVVRDHFLNFMQQKEDDPTKRVFIDKNGLRHYWSEFNDDKSLRRSEGDVTTFVKDLNGGEVALTGNIEDIVDKETKSKEDDGPKDEVNTELDGKRKPKRKPKQAVIDKVIMKPALRTDAAGKTMAITYFYCPFFGVMSLSAFVD